MKSWTVHDIKSVKPLNAAQEAVFHSWFNRNDGSLLMHGSAGTGKTYIGLYLAMCSVLNKELRSIKIVRSVVSTRDIGFLPGDLNEKLAVYETPYIDIVDDFFGRKGTYADMKRVGLIEFIPTSFCRGLSINDSAILLDEAQNTTHHEFNSILTRVGYGSRVIVMGDTKQNDLVGKRNERSGFADAIKVMNSMSSFDCIEFHKHDIVRSGFTKEWITAAEDFDFV